MKKLKLKALELGATELLSREQLQHVFGGDGSSLGNDSSCPASPCSVYNMTDGKTYYGSCGLVVAAMDFHTVSTVCECVTSLGFYIPTSSNGHSACNP